MVVSLRRHLVTMMLILALLAGLLGWTMRIVSSAPPLYPHIGTHSSSLGFIPKPACLPPPVSC